MSSDQFPAVRRKKKKKKQKSNTPLIVGAALGSLLLLSTIAVGAYFLFKPKPKPQEVELFPNMLAHWSFDDTQGQSIRDSSKRGNHGTLMGGMIAKGYKGNGFWADGRDDQYVDLAGMKDLNFAEGTDFTVAAWVQTNEKAGGTILAFRHHSTMGHIDIFSRDNRLIGIVADDTFLKGGNEGFLWCHPKNEGQWHHVALVRRGKIVEIYYDGQKQGENQGAICGGSITTDISAIGCHRRFVADDTRQYGRPGFKGCIDEVYVFNRALPDQEIQALMRR
jgi:hypothetical protein